ncbi:MAG TPA: preprotein translocase subunit SecE [Actinomycetota bacterium]|nr:preprotein translocase subunit SecE [Actinomycetota bacterium]
MSAQYNRQQRRLLKKQEDAKRTGSSGARPPVRPPSGAGPTKRERTKPRQFVKEVIAELRKVAWPSRPEVVAYSVVVLISLIIVATLIFGMDFVFTKAVLGLFGIET